MLGKIQIVNEIEVGETSISNTFIDDFMADANDAQIKVYLFLLRTLQSNSNTTVSYMADKFNHTERDIKNALTFWEKKGLIRLEYNLDNKLSQIYIEDLCSQSSDNDCVTSVPSKNSDAVTKDKDISEDRDLSMTMFAAEAYFKRPLSSSETQTILYVYNTLNFPADLIDYLLQYTAENAKGGFSAYMEKVALSWHSEGIDTLDKAKKRTLRFSSYVYEIMKLLGLPNSPTKFEAEFAKRWINEYGFSMDIISVACKKTVFNAQSHRFEYAESILKNWYNNGVNKKDDIVKLEQAYNNRTPKTKKQAVQIDKQNRFNKFKSHEYDFDLLKKTVVNNN